MSCDSHCITQAPGGAIMNSIQSCEVTSGQAESGFSSWEHKNRTVAMKTVEQVSSIGCRLGWPECLI